MLPTPSPADRDGSVRRVLAELNCNEVKRAIKRLTKLSLADGPACASAPVGGRKRARSLRRQGATFPSSYAPPMLVPQEVQDVHEHMQRAVRLDHPAAAEQAALPQDCAAALQKMLAEDTAETCRRRERAMRRIRDVAQDLAGVRARVDAAKPEHVRQMPQQCDVPLLYCLAEAAGCPDSSALAVGMACGFDAVGDIAPSGWWDVDVTLASRDIHALDHDGWVLRLEHEVRASAANDRKRAEADAVRAKTIEEVKEGLMRGPFTRQQIDDAYGHGGWRPMHRFGVHQGGKIRPCDNARSSLHNECTSTFETLLLDRPDFPARVCAATREMTARAGRPMPRMAGGTDDVASAYRHVPTADPRWTVVVLLGPQGEPEYFTLSGFNFGLKAAVPQFNRVTEALTAVARRVLGVVCTHYFDDFATVEPASVCLNGQTTLGAMMRAVGLPFAPKKHVPAAETFAFLGVESHLGGAAAGEVHMRVSQARIDSIVEQCQDILDSETMPPSEASRLAGRLYFTLTWAFGRVGRACLQPILHETPGPRLSRAAAAALEFLVSILPNLRPQRFRLERSLEPPTIVYSDGCHEGDTMDVGFIVGSPTSEAENTPATSRTVDMYTWQHGGDSIPHDLREAFVARKQQIGQVEIIGAIIAYLSVPAELVGRRIIHFVDNTSAIAAMTKGYSNMPDSARLVHTFHAWQAGAESDVWFEYVPSKANPADEPSRVPALWYGPFTPAPGVASVPRDVVFPPLSDVDNARAWQRDAEIVRASSGAACAG
jgi:hypothetical protein